MTRRSFVALGLVVGLLTAACGGGAPPEETPTDGVRQAGFTFGVAVHADPGVDAFWAVVKKGAEQAGSDLGVTVNVQGSGDVAQQAQIVEQFVTQNVDGIAVSLANPEGMQDAVRKAVDGGIPVITINSGVDVFQELGAITHIGQTETIAGEAAGERFNEAGASKAICVLHEEGNIGLEQRCDGFASTFEGDVEKFSVASTGVQDLGGTLTAIQDKVTAESDIDGVLALNPDVGIAARDAIQAAGREVSLATFDLSPNVLDAIEDGEILFAIDQQQYLQGYLPVVFLYLFKTNLNTVGGGQPVLTGPGFVTKENAAQVKDLAAEGTR